MRVRIRLFAGLRERAGAGELELELPDGALVGDALEKVRALTEGIPVVMAVNHEYADPAAPLHGGDELALIPPVSGGEVGAMHTRLTSEPLTLDPLVDLVRDPRAGAVVTFLGVTREVPELEYEAYAEMAEPQMAEIVRAAIERHGLCAAAVEHRVGTVALSEPSVAIAVSAPHREAAFAGAREIIDEIKVRVPIWKKEEGEWVRGVTPQPWRSLPAVHELAGALDAPHVLAVAAARRAIEERRAWLASQPIPDRLGGELRAGLGGELRAGLGDEARDGLGDDRGTEQLVARAREILAELQQPSLRRVINATGVILHTNLGRAPLAASAREAVARVAEGYSNLELELESGERGSRHAHVAGLLGELTGAEDAIVVNNGAGAVLLAAAALAGPGRGIVVARGQLVEIGGGFRIPEVIAQSGARLIEVGTTNRTRLADYERALTTHDDVGAIMRVHQSNFRTVGFVEDVPVEALCELGVPVIDDVGSGWLAGQPAFVEEGGEPHIGASVAAGAALVCCSGDKLLGGPQAGLIVGRREAVAAARRHPLARALRIDKLSLAALEATLRLYREPDQLRTEIPVLAMLAVDEATLGARAERLAAAIGEPARVARTVGKVGGGALPLLELEGPAVALEAEPEALARALREADPPVIARIYDGQVILDPRTLTDDEIPLLVGAVRAALAG